MPEIIYKYFPNLTRKQHTQIEQMYDLYSYWNERINVISRKDIDNLYINHILHSLAIAKVHSFPSGSIVMDLGCGGGFPGIPLAVLFPEVHFKMVDSIGKKILVVQNIAKDLNLDNIETFHCRAENIEFKTDYIVSRAVTELKTFMQWSWNKIKGGDGRGILYLKGGDLSEEISTGIKGKKNIQEITLTDISTLFKEDFFQTKKVLYIKKGK